MGVNPKQDRGENDAPSCNSVFLHRWLFFTGNGTIGLEIAEDLEKVDVVISPFGGGGLSTGIGSAMKALCPDSRLYVCEVSYRIVIATVWSQWCT